MSGKIKAIIMAIVGAVVVSLLTFLTIGERGVHTPGGSVVSAGMAAYLWWHPRRSIAPLVFFSCFGFFVHVVLSRLIY